MIVPAAFRETQRVVYLGFIPSHKSDYHNGNMAKVDREAAWP